MAGLASAGVASAQPAADVENILSKVDAVLTAGGARRVETKGALDQDMGGSLCQTTEPNAQNRDFICDKTSLAGRWTLQNLRADGGRRVDANLEVRRFLSKEQAWESKAIALARYGGKRGADKTFNAGLKWCQLEVFWTDELVVSLWYTCSVSLRHVKTLKAVRAELISAAVPFEQTGVIGVDEFLMDEKGQEVSLPDALRYRHFVRVTDVAVDDVLWLREKPMGAKLDKLLPTATCVPVVFVPPARARSGETGWLVVKFNGREGWVNRRYVTEQREDECSPADAGK